ncbi:hypothetical protein OKW30_000771 [Paraburkholderia sp. Clong3]
MDSQQQQPIGGLMASAAMLATQDTRYSVAVAEAAGLLDALWAPGGVRSASLAGVRRSESIPHGFANAETFSQFGNDIRIGLSRAGYADAEPILQGSAVTGKSFRTGQFFDVGRVSDFDIGLASPS